MFFYFLVEDNSTHVLVEHIINKVKSSIGVDIYYNIKSFHGIGHLRKNGTALEQKTGKLLNDLPMYMRGIGKKLQYMEAAAIIVVLDNDKRNKETFLKQLEDMATENRVASDYVFCIAVKEMEAWLLGDAEAVVEAYPKCRKSAMKKYEQDAIGDTWEVLADAVYPGGLIALKKKAENDYRAIGIMKEEWADRIGRRIVIERDISPSFQYMIQQLTGRLTAA